jgi:hypothetical protein
MRTLKWLAVIVVALAVALAARSQYRSMRSAGRAAAEQAERERITKQRAALLEELRPVTLENCHLARVGGPGDGGYLMCENLLQGIETAYSYGLGGEDAWGCQVSSRYRVPVHQYDCFDPKTLPCPEGVFKPNVECVGPRAEQLEGRLFDTVANQIAKNGDTGKKMVVKMDVEGAEWLALLAMPEDVLTGIDQLPMELHGLDDPEVLEGLRRLKTHFHLVYVHFNNYACGEASAPLPAWAFQVLFVNKRLGVIGAPPPGSPTAASLAAPDNPKWPDCQLPGMP